jgi:hypothetical protein
MIDPFDAALSAFIDTLPEQPEAARQLLDESAPFSGQGDLPALAEFATQLRSVPVLEPRAEWVAASKARLMAAPILPPEKRGFTWLGSMFLPLTQLTFPTISLPRLSMPSPVFARAVMAVVLILALASVARNRSSQNPILQVTGDQAPIENAQQAIDAAEAEVARLAQTQVAGVEIRGTSRDLVLLSKRIELADLAIDQAPAAEQPRLRAQLQGAVRAVRFDGQLEGVTNGSTLQVSGVAVQADPSTANQLQVGQPVSLLVTVTGRGQLQAVQVNQPAPPSSPPSSSPATSSAPSPAPPPPNAGGGTAPPTSSSENGTAAGASSTAASSSEGHTAVSPAADEGRRANARGADEKGSPAKSEDDSTKHSNNSPVRSADEAVPATPAAAGASSNTASAPVTTPATTDSKPVDAPKTAEAKGSVAGVTAASGSSSNSTPVQSGSQASQSQPSTARVLAVRDTTVGAATSPAKSQDKGKDGKDSKDSKDKKKDG